MVEIDEFHLLSMYTSFNRWIIAQHTLYRICRQCKVLNIWPYLSRIYAPPSFPFPLHFNDCTGCVGAKQRWLWFDLQWLNRSIEFLYLFCADIFKFLLRNWFSIIYFLKNKFFWIRFLKICCIDCHSSVNSVFFPWKWLVVTKMKETIISSVRYLKEKCRLIELYLPCFISACDIKCCAVYFVS